MLIAMGVEQREFYRLFAGLRTVERAVLVLAGSKVLVVVFRGIDQVVVQYDRKHKGEWNQDDDADSDP